MSVEMMACLLVEEAPVPPMVSWAGETPVLRPPRPVDCTARSNSDKLSPDCKDALSKLPKRRPPPPRG